ncbi:MAG: aldo/keto reductase [Cyanobacteriota bacterium]
MLAVPPPPSRLGFGTAGLMGAALTDRGRLRLLEEALELGITHFDTAPLYGQGQAEEVLGRFARGQRDRITITTKFGLLPRAYPPGLRPLLPLVRVLNRRLRPRLEAPLRRLRGGGGTGNETSTSDHRDPGLPSATVPAAPTAPVAPAPVPPPVPYTREAIRSHVETSLRKLKCDCIDYYLLHECRLEYLSPEVFDCLEELIQAGWIRRYGIGSGRWQSRRILEEEPAFQGVVQIPDTAFFLERAVPPLFTHGCLRLDGQGLAGLAQLPAAQLQQWSERCGRSLVDADGLSAMLLAVALHRNPQGCVVFSTRQPQRLRANAGLAGSPPPPEAIEAFLGCLASLS